MRRKPRIATSACFLLSSHSKIVGALEESNLEQQSLPILLQQHIISIII
jgi:hypothetical protein